MDDEKQIKAPKPSEIGEGNIEVHLDHSLDGKTITATYFLEG